MHATADGGTEPHTHADPGQPDGERRQPIPEQGAADPLAARPVRHPEVEAKADAAGHLQLRRACPPENRVARWLAGRFGWRKVARVQLDAVGSAFWRGIDGTRDLAALAEWLRCEFGGEPERYRGAVLAFTRDLMARGLIFLHVDRIPETYRKEVRHGG